MPSGSEPEEVDVAIFYVQTGDLQALSAPKEVSCSLCEALDTVQWTEACSALLDIRRLALHHPDDLIEVLDLVLPMIIKHMNSLRSSLCKTALICVADLFKYCGDLMAVKIQEGALIETLLSKAALEKKFVMDEAKRTLDAMIQTISTEETLHVMLFHVQSTNCKVRAVVAVCVADIVDRAFVEKQESAEVSFASFLTSIRAVLYTFSSSALCWFVDDQAATDCSSARKSHTTFVPVARRGSRTLFHIRSMTNIRTRGRAPEGS